MTNICNGVWPGIDIMIKITYIYHVDSQFDDFKEIHKAKW